MVGVIFVAAALGACANDSDGDHTSPIPTPAPPGTVSPAAAEQLCDMILVDLDFWRVQGPGVGRIAFEGYVRAWAAEYESAHALILHDPGFIDEMTIQQCPQVRERALVALDVDDLASGLVGYT
ncbi:hypothetical protein [Nocardia cyriacigeorgica]|uniref:hypothetical protein n=1 Tax=Nocardia cyriacigeorgica TaxID=135487 RepID=UPI0024558CD7|nr:hypothetical protein [Nocardia cyriacigeorgica]